MYCENCGTHLPDASKFCGRCGQRLEEELSTRICPNCKTPAEITDKFCLNCGTKIDDAIECLTTEGALSTNIHKKSKLYVVIAILAAIVVTLFIIILILILNKGDSEVAGYSSNAVVDNLESGPTLSDITSNSVDSNAVSDHNDVQDDTVLEEFVSETTDYDDCVIPKDIDYYSYYDPINNRTSCLPNGKLYVGANDDTLHELNVDPMSIDGERVFPTVEANMYSQSQFILDNYFFFYGDGGLEKYDFETGLTSIVVEHDKDIPWYMGFTARNHYLLGNDNKIYGLVITYEDVVYENSDGELDIATIYNWNLVRINNDYSGYTILHTFNDNYDYCLYGVYDGVAYYSKSELETYSSMIGGGVATDFGDVLGFYGLDIETKTENKVFGCYDNSGYAKGDAMYQVIEIDNEVAFLYIDYSDSAYHCYLNKNLTGWKEVFSTKNQISVSYNGVQVADNKLYIALSTDSYGANIYYEVTSESQTYLGMGDHNAVVFKNPITGIVQYVDQNCNIKSFE